MRDLLADIPWRCIPSATFVTKIDILAQINYIIQCINGSDVSYINCVLYQQRWPEKSNSFEVGFIF